MQSINKMRMKDKKIQIKRKTEKRLIYKIVLAILLILILLTVFIVDVFFYPIQKFWLKFTTSQYKLKPEDALRVHFIDVGQGDSTILEFPDNKTMLIDGGNDTPEVERTVLKYIESLSIRKFDYILATHSDTDHVGALDAVLQTYGAKEVYMPYIDTAEKNTAFTSFYATAQASNAKLYTTQMSQTFTTTHENFYYMLCLSPLGPHDSNSFYHKGDSNDSSAVLYLEYAGHSILLTGDASSKVEKHCIDAHQKGVYNNIVSHPNTSTNITLSPKLNDITFYKAGHHGSNTSSSQELLDYIQPKEVFISCGAGNSYGHPHIDTLNRFKNGNAKIHRTDISKNIVLTIYKNGQYTIEYH